MCRSCNTPGGDRPVMGFSWPHNGSNGACSIGRQAVEGVPLDNNANKVASPENQAVTGEGSFGSVEIESDEAKADFMNRWGDVVSQIEGFDYNAGRSDPQWLEFQKLAE